MGNRVSLYKLQNTTYPRPDDLYGPAEQYQEYLFHENVSGADNEVYHSVRESLRLLGMDQKHYGTPEWNPFSGQIRPGNTVVLKPNMVLHYSHDGQNDMETLVTHGSVIRAVLDYVFLAIGKTGKVIVCDSPQGTADFDKIVEFMHLRELQEFYAKHGFELNVFDLRKVKFHRILDKAIFFYYSELRGDPNGYRTVNLDEASLLANLDIDWKTLTGASLNRSELHKHHNKKVHEYFVAQTILNADFFISLPKMKTHKKCGVTLNLKNLVGINGNKNYLPHFATYFGQPETRLQRAFLAFRCFMSDTFLGRWGRRNVVFAHVCLVAFLGYSFLAKSFAGIYKHLQFWKKQPTSPTGTRMYAGNSPENDITWRMVLDLNRILQYAGKDGRLRPDRQRRLFSFIDGIVAGERQGPLAPDRKEAGVLVGGEDMVLVDGLATSIMGLEPSSIRLMTEAIKRNEYPLGDYGRYDEMVICTNDERYGDLENVRKNHLDFEPPQGWDHIKIEEE